MIAGFDTGSILVYPLPVLWSAWTYWRLKKRGERHTYSLLCVCTSLFFAGACYLTHSPWFAYAVPLLAAIVVSLICLLKKPWMTEIDRGLQLRAWNFVICAFYFLSTLQAYNPGD